MNVIVRNALHPLLITGLTVIACIFYWFSLLDTQQVETAAAKHRGELQVQQLNEAVDQQLDATLRSVDIALKHLVHIYLDNRREFDHSVRDLLASYPDGMLQYAVVIGANGYVAYSSESTPKVGTKPIYLGDREHFRVHAEGDGDQLFISDPIIGRISGITLIQITRPIRQGKRFIGVIGIPLRPDYLSKNLWNLHIDSRDLISIVRENGRIIARSRNLEEGLKLKTPSDRPFMNTRSGEHGIFRSTSITDKLPLLFSWRHLNNYPIIAVTAVDEIAEINGITSQQSDVRRHTLFGIALVCCFALWVSILLGRVNRKNKDLSHSEFRYRNLIGHNNAIILQVEPESGKILDANQSACNFYGWTHEELCAKCIQEINELPPEQVAAEREAALKENRSYFIFPHRLASGETKTVEVHSTPVNDGIRPVLVSIIHDITQRIHNAERIDNLVQEQNAILNSDFVGIVKLKNRKFIWTNKAFAKMLGYTQNEMVGQSTRIVYPSEGAYSAFANAAYPVMQKGKIFRTELQYQRKDGTKGWYDISGDQLRNGSDESIWAFVDISNRKEIEKDLQRENEQKNALLRNASDGIHILNSHGEVIEASDSFCRMLGYQRGEIIGMKVSQWDAKFSDQELEGIVTSQSRSREQTQFETVHKRKDGTCFDVEIRGASLELEGKQVMFYSSRDISDRKQAAIALQESELRFRSIFEDSPIGLATTSLDGHFLIVNHALCKILDYRREQLLRMTFFDVTHSDDINLTNESREKLLSGEISSYQKEKRLVSQDGRIVWVQISSSLERNDKGDVYFIAQVEDISERKYLEEALKRENAKILTIWHNSSDGIHILDKNGLLIEASDSFFEMLGYQRDELIGKYLRQWDVQKTDIELGEIRNFLFSSNQSIRFETRHQRKDGSVLDVEISSRSVSYDKQTVTWNASRDISERNIIQRQLKSLLAEQSLMLETDIVGIIKVRNRIIHYANASFENSLGYCEGELLGKSTRILYADEESFYAVGDAYSIVNQGKTYRTELQFVRCDGSPIWVELSGVILDSELSESMWTITDISERRELFLKLHQSEQEYRLLIERMPYGVLIHRAGKILLANQVAANLLGADNPSALIGVNPLQLLHPEYHKVAEKRISAAIERGEDSGLIEEKLIRMNGSEFFADVAAISVFFDKEPASLVVFTNITERKNQEEELRIAASVYQNSSEGMLITDADTKIVAINPAFTELTGYTYAEVVGKSPTMLQSGKQSKQFYQEMWSQLNSIGHWHGELWNRRKDGNLFAEQLHINAEKNSDGSIHRYIALFSDITDKKSKDEVIWKHASFDQLTGLPNRRLFHDRLEQETKLTQRNGTLLALLFIDLDHFKEVNDTLGHAKGDVLLVEATRRIRSCVRDSDTVARLGGDEFTVILPNYSDTTNLERIVQNILRALEKPFDLGSDDQGHISASIGISLFPEDTNNLEILMQFADQAMYAAKLSGRNRSHFFMAEMQNEAMEKMTLTNDLREALARNELEVYYQPIVEAKTGNIYKAEALIRWNHPKRGMISPVNFIPLAEETGLILEIGEWVFMEAIRSIENWRVETGKLIQVSVNKSPVQFVRGERHDWIQYLAESKLPVHSVTVEITEGLLITDSDKVRNELLEFKNKGIEVAIDDFGTGFSALSYLNQFDIDYLKIDISFIRNIVESESHQSLTEAIIVMAHKLGIKTIAEGVETKAQRDWLVAFGCDYIQGYYYSRPITESDFKKLLLN
jgi:diguanylate cyclase (GGDEF)-like protein/PAS domain S-box-containing protein